MRLLLYLLDGYMELNSSNLKADVTLKISEKKTSFKDYPDYSFDDDSKSFESEEEEVFRGRLDSTGKVEFYNDISVGKSSPGMLNALI